MNISPDASLIRRAHAITETFAAKILDTDRFVKDAERSGLNAVQTLRPGSLDNGHVGAALFLAAMAKATGERAYRKAAHAHIERAVNVGQHGVGLYSGWAGVLAVARYSAGNGPGYKNLIETLQTKIERALSDFCSCFADPLSVYDFDIIGGISGTLLALDRRVARVTAEYFEWLTADEMRWKLPMPGRESLVANNLGMAHGISGVLMTLALFAPDSLQTLKERIVAYIVKAATTENGLMAWTHAKEHAPHVSCGWCYGSASISNAVWEASRQLGKTEWTRASLESVERHARLTAVDSEIMGWSLCHGKAGVMMQRAAFARVTESETLAEGARSMLRTVIEEYDPERPFGYSTVLPSGEVDSNGFLLGASGTFLAILSLTTDIDVSWMRTFFAMPV